MLFIHHITRECKIGKVLFDYLLMYVQKSLETEKNNAKHIFFSLFSNNDFALVSFFPLFNEFSDCACGSVDCVDHAVLMVGYDDTASVPYFKIKNSWGTQVSDIGKHRSFGFFFLTGNH